MRTGLLLSGGIDSSALAFWKRPAVCLTVDYGQLPAQAEITAARHIATQIGSRHEILTVDCGSLGSGDLAIKPALEMAPAPEWWPFRNQLLITFCAIRALELGIDELMLGSVRSDAIHGDGTQDFFAAMRAVLACQEGALKLSTPAITMTSPDLVSASGIPLESLVLTHSCHTGDLACGTCRGCQRRFTTYQALGLEAREPAAQMSETPQPLNLADSQKPEDLLGLVKHERLRLLIATIALDGTKLPDDPRPDWAIRAAAEFWKCCQDFPRTKRAQAENYRMGFMLGVVNRLTVPEALKAEPALLAVASPQKLMSLLHAEFAKAPASDAADFYAGFSDGLKRGQLSPRSPYAIYLLFAAAWPELSELKNVTQLHEWLGTNLGSNMTGSRDRIAKICQKVRMPLTDRGGRPRQKPRNAPWS